jgi:hypothetical protein
MCYSVALIPHTALTPWRRGDWWDKQSAQGRLHPLRRRPSCGHSRREREREQWRHRRILASRLRMVRVHGAREEKGIETENHKNKTLAKCIKAKFERKGISSNPLQHGKAYHQIRRSISQNAKAKNQKLRIHVPRTNRMTKNFQTVQNEKVGG